MTINKERQSSSDILPGEVSVSREKALAVLESRGVTRREILRLLGGAALAAILKVVLCGDGGATNSAGSRENFANPNENNFGREARDLKIVEKINEIGELGCFLRLDVGLNLEVRESVGDIGEIFSKIYSGDFYEEGQVKDEIRKLIDGWVKWMQEQSKGKEINDLAEWLFYKIQGEGLVSSLEIARRMADFGNLLNAALGLENPPYKYPDAFEVAKNTVLMRENNFPKDKNSKNSVGSIRGVGDEIEIVDDRLLEVNHGNPGQLPPSLVPFVNFNTGISPQVLAAWIHSQVSVALGLIEDKGPADWEVIETEPLEDVLRLPEFLQEVIKGSPWLGSFLNYLKLVKFQQINCSRSTSPCEAWALVFGRLYEKGMVLNLRTKGEEFYNRLKGGEK